MPINQNREVFVRGYVVGLLDILNQREAIRSLAEFPGPDGERSDYIRKLKESIGVRDGIRELVRGSFKAHNEPPQGPTVDKWPPELREEYDQLRGRDIQIYEFSDTIVMHSPITNEEDVPLFRPIFATLVSCGATLLCSLASKIAIRGAVSSGYAIQNDGPEIYGPGFLEVYDLEQHVAQYPRVVVGRDLVRFLQNHSPKTGDTFRVKINAELANACLSLLKRDQDGSVIIDYLGDAFRTLNPGAEMKEIVHTAWKFAVAQHEHFMNYHNSKLALRYAWLRQYFEAHLPAWNIKS